MTFSRVGLEIREKVSRNRKNDKKCLETAEKVSRNGKNHKIHFWPRQVRRVDARRCYRVKDYPSELSAEGAKRGVRK